MTSAEPDQPGPERALAVETATAESGPAAVAEPQPAGNDGPPLRARSGRRALIAGTSEKGKGRPRWLSHAALYILLLALCAPMVALHIQRNRPLFVIDEFAYADYLYKVHSGQPFVRRGELSEQETLRALACRGFTPDSIWPERPACDSPSFDPGEFPNAGISSGDIHPPTYFVITDLGARVILASGVTENLIQAGRLFGAAWLAAGLLALWCLLRALDVNRWAAALALLFVTAHPSLRWQWHYLTPDAANLLVGSLVVLAGLRWERTGRGLLLLSGAGAFALAFKAPNLIVVGTMAAYLVVRAVLARRHAGTGESTSDFRTPRQYLVAAASLLAGGALIAAIWVVVRTAIALAGVTSPMVESQTVDMLRFGYLAENVGRFITAWDVQDSKAYPLALITSYVLIGSLLAAVAVFSPRDRRHTLALVAGGMVVVGPLILVVVTYVTTGTYFRIEPRYGASLVPLQVAIAASFWRSKAVLLTVGALVATYHAAVVFLLLRQ